MDGCGACAASGDATCMRFDFLFIDAFLTGTPSKTPVCCTAAAVVQHTTAAGLCQVEASIATWPAGPWCYLASGCGACCCVMERDATDMCLLHSEQREIVIHPAASLEGCTAVWRCVSSIRSCCYQALWPAARMLCTRIQGKHAGKRHLHAHGIIRACGWNDW